MHANPHANPIRLNYSTAPDSWPVNYTHVYREESSRTIELTISVAEICFHRWDPTQAVSTARNKACF